MSSAFWHLLGYQKDPISHVFEGGPSNSSSGGSGGSGGGPVVTATPTVYTGPTIPVPAGYARTVIIIEKQTLPGQDLFIRGGLDHATHTGTDIISTNWRSYICADLVLNTMSAL